MEVTVVEHGLLVANLLLVGAADRQANTLDAADAIALEGHEGRIVPLLGVLLLILPNPAQHLIDALQRFLVDGRHAPALVQNDNVVDVHSTVCFGLLMQIYIVFSRSLQRLQGLQNSYLTIPGIIRIFATP